MQKYFTKAWLLILWAASFASPLQAQRLFGNEWIIPGQTYLRIPVAQTGFYHINPENLTSAGFPTDSANAAKFQMFRRGKEIAIEVINKKDQQTQIQFHGERNDGTLDTALYISPNAIPHTHYSLYSDTSAYFLTWRNDGPIGKRIDYEAVFANNTSGYHFAETEKLFVSHFAPGRFYPPETSFNDGSALSAYDFGEGWTGPEIKENESKTFSMDIENALIDKISEAEIELVITGRSAGNHSFEIWISNDAGVKRMLTTFIWKDYETINYKAKLARADLEMARNITLTFIPKNSAGSISVSYIKLRYPKKGITKRPEPIPISKTRVIRFPDINPKQFDYLIITHPAVRMLSDGSDPVLAYASYRVSQAGGGYKPLVVNSEDIYDQFNYGEPGPAGIRNIISWMSQAGNLKFGFLVGRSVDPQTARKSANARELDMVPNAGWPGSDIALVMDTDLKSKLRLIVPIGRLNALHAQNVHDYLLKVKAMEAEPASAAWRKNILHLSGGRTVDELAVFSDYVKSFEQKIARSAWSVNVETISKHTTNPVEKLPVHIPINKGVSLITLFGHSSLDVTDIDIGLASDPAAQIQNHPHYPAIIVNGCAAGSIFYSTKTLNSDWIFSPNNGAILFLAHTFNGLSSDLKHYTESIYEVLADAYFTNKPFGIIQNEAIRRNLTQHKNITALITAQQMVLHGDPAIRIFPAGSPDSTAYSDDVPVDRIPPNLLVKVDKRLLQNGDFVSKEPVIEIQVKDDNRFSARTDTSGITVWIKGKCAQCIQQRIYFHNAFWEILPSGQFLMTIKLPKALSAGEYTLAVRISDSNGNAAMPYVIDFKVSNESGLTAISVSPNPSDHWFRFIIEFQSLTSPEKVNFSVYDVRGRKVEEYTFDAHSGKNEWLWHPENLPSGVYSYRLEVLPLKGVILPAAKKAMQGKLIWVH